MTHKSTSLAVEDLSVHPVNRQ